MKSLLEGNEVLFPKLFHDVQTSGIFPDGKTFADARPVEEADIINEEYEHLKTTPDFDLKSFVEVSFELPSALKIAEIEKAETATSHIKNLWSILQRKDPKKNQGNRLSLPHPYVVPGGRFREIYYWDSYFTMLGLLASGEETLAKGMLDNFAFQIKKIGFIPNGNRSYFLSRSQPPYFARMVQLLADHGIVQIEDYAQVLETEYAFWMDASGDFTADTTRRAISVGDNVLNRYWDDSPTPRPESYLEDLELAEQSTQEASILYRNLRAACESGWDFSSRWCADPMDLSTIRCAELLPVDLNCLLYDLESTLARAFSSDDDKSSYYTSLAQKRKESILKYFWNDDIGTFCDYDVKNNAVLHQITAASLQPLFSNIATTSQADSVIAVAEQHLLKDKGLLTTTIVSGQQWDAPNGWAPLQYIYYKSLLNYGHTEKAADFAKRWTALGDTVFTETGKMMEKYNVEGTGGAGGGGEYPNQDGFGWTNGVYLTLKRN